MVQGESARLHSGQPNTTSATSALPFDYAQGREPVERLYFLRVEDHRGSDAGSTILEMDRQRAELSEPWRLWTGLTGNPGLPEGAAIRRCVR